MKFIIEREAILAALGIVRTAAHRTTVPILEHVAISTFDKSVEFFCTDLNLCLRSKVDAEIQQKGETTVKALLLYELVRSFGGEHVQLELQKEVLLITSAKSKYKLGALPFTDFPPVPKLKDAVEFEMPQPILKELLARTSFACSQDASRYVLMSSLLRVNGESTTAVATDGKRLALNSGDTRSRLKNVRDILVPTFAVAELLRLLSDSEDAKPVTVAITENQAKFCIGDTHIITKLIEGNYPNYNQVIPKLKSSDGITINRQEFLSCLNRCALIHDEFTLTVRNKSLSIETTNNKELIGDAYETIIINSTGLEKPVKAKVNGRFLIEPLKAVTEDEIQLFVHGSQMPMVLKSPKGPWLNIVMPLREEERTEPAPVPANEPEPAAK